MKVKVFEIVYEQRLADRFVDRVAYVEGKTKKGAVGNLCNLYYISKNRVKSCEERPNLS